VGAPGGRRPDRGIRSARRESAAAPPSVLAVATAGAGLLIYVSLLAAGWWLGAGDGLGGRYPLWAATASISLVIWIFVFALGRSTIRRQPVSWRRGRGWWVGSCIAAAGFAGAASSILLLITWSMGSLQTTMALRLIVLLLMVLGWIAAVPWILLIWMTHEELRSIHLSIAAIREPPPTEEYDPSSVDGAAIRSIAASMDGVWHAIERAGLALGLLLSTVVLNTGVMRTVRMSGGATEDDFPAWYVLAYGVFFALVLAAILVPILAAWRDAGFALARRALGEPSSGVPAESRVAAQERLLARIGVDRGVLRRPIAAVSVLAPFVTAFVTSLVPTA
jgi:hypothetical protein